MPEYNEELYEIDIDIDYPNEYDEYLWELYQQKEKEHIS